MAESTLAVREQFSTAEQQRETATFGMWIFIATEALLFGGLFTAFTIYRTLYSSGFDRGSSEMEFVLGAVNTAVLICSSLTMVLAIHSAENGKQLRSALFIVATMAIGLVFLTIKFTEYYFHYKDHKFPGIQFTESGPTSSHVEMFFVFYFIMTGLHACHMLIGLGILTVMLYRTLLGKISERYTTPLDSAGLYWHFVDIIWVFLFAIFYIPGAHLR